MEMSDCDCLLLAHVFENTHQRAVNKLTYHPREANILISGSQDYTMNMFVSEHLLVILRVLQSIVGADYSGY